MGDRDDGKKKSGRGRRAEDEFEDIIEEAEFEAEGWEELSGDPERASKIMEALEGVVPDIVKRAVAAGVGGLADSEEKIRSALSERQIAREVTGYVLKHADATKKEVLRIVSKEIRDFLEHMDFSEELAEILTKLSLEARVEIRFIPNKDAVRPKASGKVRVKGSAGKGDEDEKQEADEADADGGDNDGDGDEDGDGNGTKDE